MRAEMPPNIELRHRVALYQSRMVHYRLPLFDRMRELCRERGIELNVLYGGPSERDRRRGDSAELPWGIRTKNRYFHFGRIEFVWQPAPRGFPRPDLVVVTQENRLLRNYVHLARRLLGGPMVAFWGHGRNFQSDSPAGLGHRWKQLITPMADWWFAYTEVSRATMIEAGADATRVTCLDNTIDTATFRSDLAATTADRLAELRRELHIAPDAQVGLFCGSLTDDKMLELLVAGGELVHRACPDFVLLVVGDGAWHDWLAEKARQHLWLKAVPARYGRDKAECFRLAEVVLNPGMVGLSIVDAMCAGLPLVTTEAGRHSPEISYLQNNDNGFMTTGTAEAFATCVIELIRSPELRKRTGEAALLRSVELTIENMARKFVDGLARCLEVRESAAGGGATLASAVSLAAGSETAQLRVPARVAFMTNMVPPYRIGTFRALAARLSAFRVLVSVGMESNRAWTPEWFDLDVRVQRNITFRRSEAHPSGFSQDVFLHIPYDSLWQLHRFRPDVVVSVEFGVRTIMAVLYKLLRPSVRLVLYADLSEHTEQGRRAWRNKIRGWLLRRADAVIVNGASGERYVRSLSLTGPNVYRVPYATDMSFAMGHRAARCAGDPIRLIHVGQLIDRKGLLPFFGMLTQWCKRHPAQEVELILAGDGPQRQEIAALETVPNLRVDFRGLVRYEMLPELYREADIMVLPTLADTWGLVVNEALAAGLPILGSRYSQAVEELVVDGQTGWVFDPKDEKDVDAALDRAMGTPIEQWAHMSELAKTTATRIDAAAVAERMLAAIEGSRVPHAR